METAIATLRGKGAATTHHSNSATRESAVTRSRRATMAGSMANRQQATLVGVSTASEEAASPAPLVQPAAVRGAATANATEMTSAV
jgi:hypothetical protein